LHRLLDLAVPGPMPTGLAWCRRDAASSCLPDDVDAIARWLAAPPEVIDGAGWMRPGWFEEASGWVHRTLHDVTDIVQVRSWMSSCVLRVRTAASGSYYFMADAGSGPGACLREAYTARAYHASEERDV